MTIYQFKFYIACTITNFHLLRCISEAAAKYSLSSSMCNVHTLPNAYFIFILNMTEFYEREDIMPELSKEFRKLFYLEKFSSIY